ncbi:MAG TPA: Holliday junction branch migration protein RuvA [Chlamydiales bacterium]|nr:Holliday junction branch migration protein RuvA [Chlamydiales bacterium]
MYEYIQGKIVETTLQSAIIDVQGIGYKIITPISVASDLPASGSQVKLFISYIVKEDSQTLYGFQKKEMRNLFEKILSISGIGPKLALGILGHITIEEFEHAIVTQNVKTLSGLPGIGKKMAEKIILEMKDKIQKFSLEQLTLASSKEPSISKDAISALVNLGYHPLKAKKAVDTALEKQGNSIDIAELISSAIKHL